MLDIELSDIIKAIGNPTKRAGHQYYFKCPACTNRGEDKAGDNLLFNDNKKLLKCFACDDGAKETLKIINEFKKDYSPTAKIENKKPQKLWWEVNKENLKLYLSQTIEELELDNNKKILDFVLKKHGITHYNSQVCGLGYDEKPNMLKIGSSITFPLFSLNHNMQLVGFELREIGENKVIKHTLSTPSCLCAWWGFTFRSKYLAIAEGHKDAINLITLLKSYKKIDIYDWSICSPAHGCKDILKNLKGLDLSQYKACYLILDNDKAGDSATKNILEQYPFFKDKRNLIKGYKDISEKVINEL